MREPYYNEPGLEAERGSREGDQNSKLYTEGARVLTLQSLLNIVKSPPRGTEIIVQEHVALRSEAIVVQCMGQQRGSLLIDCSGIATAGQGVADEKPSAVDDQTDSTTDVVEGVAEAGLAAPSVMSTAASAGCRASIGKLLPKLQAAMFDDQLT